MSLTVLMDGFALIALGLISYGTLHIETEKFAPWQWLNIIFGTVTVIASVLFFLFFPDSPATAKFLTAEEKITAIARIRVNQTGLENKRFKKDQYVVYAVETGVVLDVCLFLGLWRLSRTRKHGCGSSTPPSRKLVSSKSYTDCPNNFCRQISNSVCEHRQSQSHALTCHSSFQTNAA